MAKKEKIYLSAPITGYDRGEREAYFGKYEEIMQARGLAVFNPLKNGVDVKAPHAEHMAKDIAQLLKCDGILMLQGWQGSYGCVTELRVARACGLKVMFEGDV